MDSATIEMAHQSRRPRTRVLGRGFYREEEDRLSDDDFQNVEHRSLSTKRRRPVTRYTLQDCQDSADLC